VFKPDFMAPKEKRPFMNGLKPLREVPPCFRTFRLLAGTSNLKWNAPLQYMGHTGGGAFKGLIYRANMSTFLT